LAELTDRPFPPGSYPVVVVGSGPGGLQISYCLSRLGIGHAVLSADDAPGGMFRRWPFFQRLLSWTKPFAPVARTDPAYERYDWNSLLAEEPENQALMAAIMDGTSYFPSRPEIPLHLGP
jgi:glycine/D-amino acid oxidase-like deaminating enzyme